MNKAMSLLTAVIMIMSMFAMPALAAEPIEHDIYASEQSLSTMQEETMWYFRVNNGVLQHRLWSITYGYWLTEWENF